MNNFKEYIKNDSPQEKFALKLLNGIKNTFNCMISNSEGIQNLILVGESIINLLK